MCRSYVLVPCDMSFAPLAGRTLLCHSIRRVRGDCASVGRVVMRSGRRWPGRTMGNAPRLPVRILWPVGHAINTREGIPVDSLCSLFTEDAEGPRIHLWLEERPQPHPQPTTAAITRITCTWKWRTRECMWVRGTLCVALVWSSTTPSSPAHGHRGRTLGTSSAGPAPACGTDSTCTRSCGIGRSTTSWGSGPCGN